VLVLVDLGLRFVESGGGSEGFGYRLAIDFACEAQLRIVARIVGLGTVASRLSAAASDSANRAWAQIAEGGDLAQDLGALVF
jgi:hypothetical protein